MADVAGREPAPDPQDPERLLVSRQRSGDVEGTVALYEPQAVLNADDGRLLQGWEAIRAFFAETVAAGRKFAFGEQRPALISGDLALTSTRLPDGSVTAEVARRQGDGTWLWVIDKFYIAQRVDPLFDDTQATGQAGHPRRPSPCASRRHSVPPHRARPS
ncbi:MAG: nuclear transport factor 2 family protein [Rhodospirillales bacterium]|nr:nuclear transport factor 2 family protein [Rhodospirillales bacterium]